jgi:hypothetical protein
MGCRERNSTAQPPLANPSEKHAENPFRYFSQQLVQTHRRGPSYRKPAGAFCCAKFSSWARMDRFVTWDSCQDRFATDHWQSRPLRATVHDAIKYPTVRSHASVHARKVVVGDKPLNAPHARISVYLAAALRVRPFGLGASQ